MDTGASINCIGGSLALELIEREKDLISVKSTVRTADGKGQANVEKINTIICFREKINDYNFTWCLRCLKICI